MKCLSVEWDDEENSSFVSLLGRQPLIGPAERAVRQVWDTDASLARPSSAEAGGAQGVPQAGDQEGAEGIEDLFYFMNQYHTIYVF